MEPVWEGLIDNLKKEPKAWKEWYDLESPESSPIPCDYSSKLSRYQ
jgi:hypothetical protein